MHAIYYIHIYYIIYMHRLLHNHYHCRGLCPHGSLASGFILSSHAASGPSPNIGCGNQRLESLQDRCSFRWPRGPRHSLRRRRPCRQRHWFAFRWLLMAAVVRRTARLDLALHSCIINIYKWLHTYISFIYILYMYIHILHICMYIYNIYMYIHICRICSQWISHIHISYI